MEKTGPTVSQLSEFITKLNWISLLLIYLTKEYGSLFSLSLSLLVFSTVCTSFVCVYVCFQQREPFKKRWFTICSINRKLLYFKTPLVINGQ